MSYTEIPKPSSEEIAIIENVVDIFDSIITPIDLFFYSIYTEIGKPEGTSLWSDNYYPWLDYNYPWEMIDGVQFRKVDKPSKPIYSNIQKPVWI